jgi:hypothetical protein
LESDVANAKLGAATAMETAERERLARVKIEALVAWRRIEQSDQPRTATRLARFKGQSVGVWFNAGDLEGHTFASDIEVVLRAAGWRIATFNSLLSLGAGKIETGVNVVATGDDASRNAARSIVSELVSLGFDAELSPNVERRTVPVVIVNVRAKPNEPQGRAKLSLQNP